MIRSRRYFHSCIRANHVHSAGLCHLANFCTARGGPGVECAVQELDLQGAMVFGRTRDRNLDHHDFWPILETASALKAPLYLHPQTPQNGVLDAYYTGFGEDVDSLFARGGIGWHYEAGVQILRDAALVGKMIPDYRDPAWQ